MKRQLLQAMQYDEEADKCTDRICVVCKKRLAICLMTKLFPNQLTDCIYDKLERPSLNASGSAARQLGLFHGPLQLMVRKPARPLHYQKHVSVHSGLIRTILIERSNFRDF